MYHEYFEDVKKLYNDVGLNLKKNLSTSLTYERIEIFCSYNGKS